MVLIRAALRDRVDHSAGGPPVFCGVVRSVHLKFLNGSLGAGIADARAAALFGKEGLIIVAAVHRVVVEQCAHAAEADESKTVDVIHCAGSEKNEIRPAAAVDGEVANGRLIDSGSEFGGDGIDLRD